MLRADYQVSSTLRFTAKYAGQLQGQDTDPGSLPGFNDLLRWNRNRHAPSVTVNYNLSSSMFIEGTYGYSFNEIANLYVSPLSNRANAGLADLPMLFPQAGLVDPSYNAARVFGAANSPFFTDGRVMYPPNFSWGARIANAPPNLGAQLANINPSHDASFSLTKLVGRHTLKAGAYWNHAYKAQQLGTAGATPFQGALSFANDTQNPLDSGFGYANAALGILSSYAQQSVVVEGGYIYNNLDWYLQDNWKVSNKLTLDYGMRFVYMQPTYDTRIQASTFFLDQWQGAQAPLLYTTGCAGASPCSGTNRQAMDPRTGQLLGPTSGVLIGQIVPNSGNLMNGIVRAGDGISKYNYTWPAVVAAPRFGLAYDVSGAQRMVVRGGIGLFHDRPAGDTMYSQVGNPGFSTSRTVRYALLQQLASGLEILGPPQLTSVWPYEADIPSSTQWNAGVQMTLPWASTIDVSYVGQHGFNQLREIRGQTQVDINAVDFDAAFLPQNQDPTLAASSTPGATAYSTDLLRPYRGLGQVGFNFPDFHETYHSIQASLNRRFRDGIAFGLAYTLGLAWEGNIGLLQRLDHSADGTYVDPGRPGRVRRAEQGHGQPAPPAEGELPVGSAGSALDERGHEGRGPAGERLAALRHPDRRIRRPVRHQLLVPERRFEREPDRVAQLPGHDPHRRRYGKGLLGQPVRAVQRRRRSRDRRLEAWDWSRAATTWRAVRITRSTCRSPGTSGSAGRARFSSASTRSTR